MTRELSEIFAQAMTITTPEGWAEYGLVACGYPVGYVEPPAPDPQTPQTNEPPWRDIIATIPTNPKATNPAATPGVWAKRDLKRITGITVHHTLNNDPVALARYIVTNKQLPTTEYAVFIRENGEALLCVPLDVAFWHDHTGYPNYHVSVGLEGNRTKGIPAAQLESLATVCAYLVRLLGLASDSVKGHSDYAATACPGWNDGGWKAEFYQRLGAKLAG